MEYHAKRKTLPYMLLCVLAAVSLSASGAADEVNRGRALYVKDGCYECHGYVGQGSVMSGPSLAPSPIPVDAMIAYVHAPKGQMPPYSAKILSDRQISDIHAYLASIPQARPADSIPLLSPTAIQAKPAAHAGRGQAVFAAHCAACHGAQGGGGPAPSLKGVDTKYGGLAGIAAFIKAPTGAMPKLFPDVITEQDIAEVSNYVATLK